MASGEESETLHATNAQCTGQSELGPTEVPGGPPGLDKEEVARLVHAVERERRRGVRPATDQRDEALAKVLVEAGLRLAEVVGLDRADLDLGPRHGWVHRAGHAIGRLHFMARGGSMQSGGCA